MKKVVFPGPSEQKGEGKASVADKAANNGATSQQLTGSSNHNHDLTVAPPSSEANVNCSAMCVCRSITSI